jgi:hypothetical protein
MNLIALEGFCGGGSLNLNFPPPFSHEVGRERGGGGGGKGGKCQASEFQNILNFRLENIHLYIYKFALNSDNILHRLRCWALCM